MDMLDPAITNYVLHVKACEFGGGDIFDNEGNKLGSMRRKIVSPRVVIALRDLNETPICIISEKLVAARQIYDVRLPNEQLIGCAKKPLITFRGSIAMYNADDKMIYKARGVATKRITDPKDKKKVYAEIRSLKDKYVIHVVDPDVDRLMLLAYAVIVYHDK